MPTEVRTPVITTGAVTRRRMLAIAGEDVELIDSVTGQSNPYRNGERSITVITDSAGREWWMDEGTRNIIQMGAQKQAGFSSVAGQMRECAEDVFIEEQDEKTTAQLRTVALTLFKGLRPNDTLARLYPLEANKDRQVYFFRWDDFGRSVSEEKIPPFFQVGIRADGKVVSFTDTLTGSQE